MSQAAETRERLLDSAEKLFAEHGLDAVSLRQITGEAGANLAAVNYHFGSKEALMRAVIDRRVQPMNAERLRLLDELEADEASPELDAVVRAFLAPALSLGIRRGAEFFVIVARAHGTPRPALRDLLAEEFQEVAMRFGGALSRCLPELSRGELLWRMHFVVGALCHTVINADLLEAISGGDARPDGEEAILDRLVAFAVAGLSAEAGGAA